ncbi:MAG TPA: hypothetical protein EYP62_05640 [Kiritimatiellae bacterium]|nr:hypothetical protein [Kiritimatiellia bacterium]
MSDREIRDPLLQNLLEEGRVTPDQVREVVEEQSRTGRPTRDLLIDMGLLTEDELLESIAEMLGTRVVNLAALDIPQKVLKAVPASVARMYNVVPVEADAQSVVLATFDLLSPEEVDEIAFVLTRDVSFLAAREEDIKTYLQRFYGDDSESVVDMLEELESELEETEGMVEVGVSEGNAAELERAANLTPRGQVREPGSLSGGTGQGLGHPL